MEYQIFQDKFLANSLINVTLEDYNSTCGRAVLKGPFGENEMESAFGSEISDYAKLILDHKLEIVDAHTIIIKYKLDKPISASSSSSSSSSSWFSTDPLGRKKTSINVSSGNYLSNGIRKVSKKTDKSVGGKKIATTVAYGDSVKIFNEFIPVNAKRFKTLSDAQAFLNLKNRSDLKFRKNFSAFKCNTHFQSLLKGEIFTIGGGPLKGIPFKVGHDYHVDWVEALLTVWFFKGSECLYEVYMKDGMSPSLKFQYERFYRYCDHDIGKSDDIFSIDESLEDTNSI